MDTTQSIQPGAAVWSADNIKLGTVARVENDKAFLDYQGQELAIPLTAFSGAGSSNHLTINKTADELPQGTWTT